MEQFRQIGEVLGSLKALMVLKNEIPINRRQCCLLFQMFNLAFETIADEISHNLKLEEKNTKWKSLERPMKELHMIFKEGEIYIRACLDTKDNWLGKVISFHQNRDCVEFHIHNLLCCFPVVIEAIEADSEISGHNHDDMQKRRHMILRKYDSEWNDPKLFQWMFGKQYLIPRDTCHRFDKAWKEDRWNLLETLREKKVKFSPSKPKHEQILGDLLIQKLNGLGSSNLMSSSGLVGAKDYCVKRRLGSNGNHYKEIHWLGENFALRTFFGEIEEPLRGDISLVLSLSHPNVIQYLCGFYDEEKKEGFLVMELMNKDLNTHIKENFSQRKRIPFSISVAVDIMLQIARGMEYLHSRKIYHGDLNPSSVLLKPRVNSSTTEGYFMAKVNGFGLNSVKTFSPRCSPNPNGPDPVIWLAPEVLSENSSKYSEKADVYSFGMLCFELLTGKVPFEDSHLQGDKMVRNIQAGERPLFPHPSPKFLTNLTRRCWHNNPVHRPSFSSLCRILRYIKKILVINPDHGQPDSPPPLVDYCDIEAAYTKKFPVERYSDSRQVSQIPFQLFSYRLLEKEKNSVKDQSLIFGDEQMGLTDDIFLINNDGRSYCSEIIESKNLQMNGSDQRSVISEIPIRKSGICDSPGNRKPVTLEIPERRFSLSVEREENKVSSPRVGDRKLLFRENSVKEASSSNGNEVKRTLSPIITNRTPVIPEKKVVVTPVTTPKVVCSVIPEKSVIADDSSIATGRNEKTTSLRKRMENAKNKIIPWTLKRNSPACSPARTQTGYTSAKSSPTPIFKSSKSSPAIYSTAGYSPKSSLQNPSTRVKQENLPSFMSPIRRIKVQQPDSDKA